MAGETDTEILSKLPPKLLHRLMPFQKKGVLFAVRKNGRCLIADEMGLGKTLQAISVSYYYRDEWPLLIIVPSSLRYCWIEEFEKWLPDIDPADINLVQSGSDVSEIGKAKVTITTFGLLSKATSRLLKEALFSQGFQVVIVDESHYIRNVKTASAKTVVPLIKNANRRVLLSGTPALSRPVELYPQIDAICPDKFGSWWHYTARYCDAKAEWIGKVRRRNVNGASNLEELQHMLASTLMIRREKSQVLTQLPPKQRQKVLFELKDSDMKKEIRQTFDELRPLLKRNGKDKFEVLTGAGEHDTKDSNMLALVSRLYQLSGEAKIGPAKEYIEMLCENPSLKFLVFAYHHAMMNGLSESLHDKHINFIRIDGDTPPSERPHLVHKFQSDPETRVAVLSILAAGVGLTFTAATVVVFAEMYWTPGTMIQCEDRAHRIGQASSVHVHYLVAKDTMDEWVWSSVCKKTIVTSTTLTGHKRQMEAAAGNKYQVDVLSNADVWVPSTISADTSAITQCLQAQLEPGQKSIRSFFSPGASFKAALNSTKPSVLDVLDKENMNINGKFIDVGNASKSPARKRRKFSDSFSKNCFGKADDCENDSVSEFKPIECIVIDDEDDFTEKIKTSGKHRKGSLKHLKKSVSNMPKMDLQAAFANANCRKSVAKEIEDTEEPIPGLNDDNSKGSSQTSGSDSIVKSCEDNGKWSCAACTFLNHKALLYCEVCETPNKEKPAKSKTLGNVQIPSDSSSVQDNEVKSKCAIPFSKYANRSTSKTMEDSLSQNSCETDNEISDDDLGHEIDFVPDIRSHNSELEDFAIDEYNRSITRVENVHECFKDGGNMDDVHDNMGGVCQSNQNHDVDSGNGQSDVTLQSQYFSNMSDGFVSQVPKRKEIVIENVLKSKRLFVDSKVDEVKEESQHEMVNKTEKNEGQEQIVTPGGSAKRYRFKSLKPGSPYALSRSSPGGATKSGLTNSPLCPSRDAKRSNTNNTERSLCRDGEQMEPNRNEVFCTESTDNSERREGDISNKATSTPATTDHESKYSNAICAKQCQTTDQHDLSFGSPEIDDIIAAQDTDVPEREEEGRVVDIENLPVYSRLSFQVSRHTGRVYLHGPDGAPLHVNFVPTDVEVGNTDSLPDVLLHPANLRLAQRFVREWSSLSETKCRLLVKSCRPFISPLQEYERLRSCKTLNQQRYKTKSDVSSAAQQKAKDIGGTVRLLNKPAGQGSNKQGETSGTEQVLGEDGTPHCLQCLQPYANHLLQQRTIHNEDNAWQTRFCSRDCAQKYWMLTNTEYIRDQVYEAEHGVCQMCKLDAHALYRHIKETHDPKKRAEILGRSLLAALGVKVKQQMVLKPTPGLFWHADHIVPVWQGGGQCDIDNLRTLCVCCHNKVTAKQAGQRANVRRLGAAVKSGDITAFFQKLT
ncbi:DNA annealing helicase and endonuclease ZRANB3-like [Mya arenaria]|uniref:DNA annealing helicase and endonuclease ZRANB3-like n=1 Tax=Mya arenaria TaxID=6604 RepID=UPI0022E1F833|nr:DNA annealing helicase and endonuclease ZRANB3-like [Mya arenaria]